MSSNHDIRFERQSALLLVAGLFVFIANPVEGSQPVRKVIVGSVINGALISNDGYHIRVRDTATREELRLDRYEGMRVRIRGRLLPGDKTFITVRERGASKEVPSISRRMNAHRMRGPFTQNCRAAD